VPAAAGAPPVAAPVLPEELDSATLADLDDDRMLDGVTLSGETAVDLAVRGVTLRRARLTGLRTPGATFDGVVLTHVVVEDCDLSGATFDGAVLERVELRRCRLSGLVAAALAATDVRLVDCRADEAWFRMARFERVVFEGCDLTGSDWYEARLRHSRIARCRLDGAELSKAAFDGVALHGTTLDGIRGAGGLRNLVIGPDQVVDVALAVFGPLGITVADEVDPPDRSVDR
jgi:hypothetical protein